MAEEKKAPASRSSSEEKKDAATKTESARRKSSDDQEVTLPGTGDDTPDTKAAEERRHAAAEYARHAIADTDPELDPEAHRDRVRNLDDAAGAAATARAESEEGAGGTDTGRMLVQISQFDESGGGVTKHLANPSKNMLIAAEAPSSRRAELRALAEEEDGDAEKTPRRGSSRRSSSSRKESDKKE